MRLIDDLIGKELILREYGVLMLMVVKCNINGINLMRVSLKGILGILFFVVLNYVFFINVV